MLRNSDLLAIGLLVAVAGVSACDEGDPAPRAEAPATGEGVGEGVGEGEGQPGADGSGCGGASGPECPPDEGVDCEQIKCAEGEVCHPASGRCVQCIGNADCTADKPTCLNLTGRCGCISSAECGALRRCDRGTESCVREMDGSRCVDDDDCPTRHCGPEAVCVFCLIDEHCDVQRGEVCNEVYECGRPVPCGQGGDHCPLGGVCDPATGQCVPQGCEGEGEGEGESGGGGPQGGQCPGCEEDAECGQGRFCDWGGRVCLDADRAAICEPCGDDSQCLRPNEPSGSCVERRAGGARLERFCGQDCEADRDCPRGYECSPIALGVSSCLPTRLEAEAGQAGVSCAALVEVGKRCASDDDCGLGGEGFCWEQACAYGCEETGEARRLCVQGFMCQPVPAEVHAWGGACVRTED